MPELPPRPPHLHHCTSEPFRFFGRAAELALLHRALWGNDPSLVAMVGPGGQGKTAIVQHWLQGLAADPRRADGVFLWSFYRGQDVDLCLRELYAYAEGLPGAPDLSAGYCVDHLLPRLRAERWAVVLDGTEVVQHDRGPWFGRFVHPELGRLLQELASEPMPGVVVLTTRFPLPELERRRHARVLSLGSLDADSARALLGSVGVSGRDADLDAAASAAGRHAKAVELLGTYLAHFRGGDAAAHRELPDLPPAEGASDEELHVGRVLAAFQSTLSPEVKDILALTTAFRQPPAEAALLAYLASGPVRSLLQDTWGRTYAPFADRPAGWLGERMEELVGLRLLERVGERGAVVLDAHPLVRRGFEHVLGSAGRRQSATARAGFLRGRPDRRRPATLEQAREEVELFHAYCDAGLWDEADGVYVALDNPKHRFLAPVFERELLLRFFPAGDWRQPPLWRGFGRYRSLAISFELLGEFEEALAAYREADAPLRGDALIALGRLQPLLDQPQAPHPWQTLWQAYRAHALCLAGRTAEAEAGARALVPVDVYEWVHVFECLLRLGRLEALDLRSVLYRPPHAAEHTWSALARQRMRADYLRATGSPEAADLGREYEALLEAYDRGGLPYERALVRLSYARWRLARGQGAEAQGLATAALDLAARHRMRIVEADAWDIGAAVALRFGDPAQADAAKSRAQRVREGVGYRGPGRP
jgi:tetratricopeptide (TPR) repeat protein